MSFERFCELVDKDTTLNYMEVQSVLNLTADMAREVVANGDIVEFGRLGTLLPSFKSKVVPAGSEFNANVHLTEPRVNLRPNLTYFRLSPTKSATNVRKLSQQQRPRIRSRRTRAVLRLALAIALRALARAAEAVTLASKLPPK
jgi:histone family DNA-binding protein